MLEPMPPRRLPGTPFSSGAAVSDDRSSYVPLMLPIATRSTLARAAGAAETAASRNGSSFCPFLWGSPPVVEMRPRDSFAPLLRQDYSFDTAASRIGPQDIP